MCIRADPWLFFGGLSAARGPEAGSQKPTKAKRYYTTMASAGSSRRKAAHGPTVNAIKRAKFEAKQERWPQAALQQNSTQTSSSWYNGREEYSAYITVEDVHIIRKLRDGIDISDIEEGRRTRLRRISDWIEPFFDLKEVPSCNTTSSSNNNAKKKKDRTFIAEGTETVRMMIQRCEIATGKTSSDDDDTETEHPPPIRLLSILSKPATFFDAPTHLLGDVEERNNLITTNNKTIPPFKIIIANEEALSAICGFRIARGAMACGVIPTYMQRNGYTWLERLLSKETTVRLLAMDSISNTANMGSILRTASAFSIDAIILSDDSCDAWYRQSVRTSMGHVISIPILRVSDWEKGSSNDKKYEGNSNEIINGLKQVIRWLRASNVECFAAVVDDDDEDKSKCFPPLVTLEHDKDCGIRRTWCCVLGNEGHGIRKEVIQECDKRIRIGMASSVDSLSLPIAAGILMHALSSRSRRS